MATVNFLYRSKREEAALNVRLLFRYNNNDYVLGGKTKIRVTKEYWNKHHNQKSPRDIDVKNKQVEVRGHLNDLESYILTEFNREHNPSTVDKQWLINKLKYYFTPDEVSSHIPNTLLGYFDLYLDHRKDEVALQTYKNYKVIRNLIDDYQSEIGEVVLIKNVNLDFKRKFEQYLKELAYSHNTIARTLQSIKAVCNHARIRGVETHVQLELIKASEKKGQSIYLNFEELEVIENLEDYKLSESLQNVRDWLLISCYTGQRFSDFIRFEPKQVRKEQDKKLIEFQQKKTGKQMTVPLHPKVLEILKKRNGNFPRPISSQKYNKYLKEICKIAEINSIEKGAVLVQHGKGKSKRFRKEKGMYEKWQLASSHVGRRSFATNFYGKIPTSHLIYITGHSTEAMFLKYIGKSNKDLALETANYFNYE